MCGYFALVSSLGGQRNLLQMDMGRVRLSQLEGSWVVAFEQAGGIGMIYKKKMLTRLVGGKFCVGWVAARRGRVVAVWCGASS